MPDTRTPEQLRRHYEVEHELAERLKQATREQRAGIYRTMYDELFARVPDHPRRVRRDTPEQKTAAVKRQMRLLRPVLTPGTVLVEFAPGDCGLAFAACKTAGKVYGIDISDQTGNAASRPANFELVVYDGYHLSLPDGLADVVFSYQMLEHIHPEDVVLHLETVLRLLRPGGVYVFSTPHRFSGPHDVSRHFTDTPTGFHLKEWTYRDMGQALRAAGFAGWHTFRAGRPRPSRLITGLTLALESCLGILPHRLRRRLSARLFESVIVVARKAEDWGNGRIGRIGGEEARGKRTLSSAAT
jgi:SAM-dependent methyltransferase